VAAELVVEREGDGDEARMRARLASGLVSLLMDTAHQCWLDAGANEPLQDVGHRCRTMMADLLGAIRTSDSFRVPMTRAGGFAAIVRG
jgi:hypothetical protein